MKATKKLFALMLALVMAMALSVTAFAESGTNTNDGTITINNAVPGQTYSVYQIAYLESYSGDNYAYKANSNWLSFLDDSDYVTVENGYVTWTGAETAAAYAAFAKAALAYAEENDIAAADSDIAPAATEGQTTSTVEFTDLNLGWYLVDTSLGSLCSLGTTAKNATIEEKNSVPSIAKEVVDGEEGENEPSVGESVNFKITVTAQEGAQNYVVHDTMSDGLTFNNDVKVTVGEAELTAGEDYDYYVATESDDCSFEVIFTESYLNSITTETEIVITYSATINEYAVVNTDPETNEAKLDYGDNSTTTSTTDTETYVYYFDLVKVDTDDKLIDGAKFKLYESETGGTAIQFVYDRESNTYRVATADDVTTTETIEVTNGIVRISGLGEGTYYLEETEAPAGYNQLASREEFTVGSNNDATVEDDTYVSGGVKIVNKTGSLLPGTGGMGTTVIYIVGALLVIGAGVVLVTRRRMSAE